jgi:hypothetical protein
MSSIPRPRKNIPNSFVVFCVIGWLLLVAALVTALVLWMKAGDTAGHLAFAFSKIDGLPVWLPVSDTGPGLPTALPGGYDPNAADFLLDQMSRYLRLYVNDSSEFELRPGITVLQKVYTENNKELSCLMLEDSVSGSVVILFKGTTTKSQIKTDLQVHTTTPNNQCYVGTLDSPILVHAGFQDMFASMRPSILDALVKSKYRKVYVCGRSLGGAMANLCLYDLSCSRIRLATEMYGLTVGSPRVGNREFAKYFVTNNLRLFQLRNTADVFPTTPWIQTPSISGKKQLYEYTHAGEGLSFHAHAENMLYAHAQITYQQHLHPSGLIPVFE